VQDRSHIAFLISKLRLLFSYERVFDIIKVERSQNRVSHTLANLARVDHSSVIWSCSGLEAVLWLIEQDHSVTLSE
jgi:hypothetical protein